MIKRGKKGQQLFGMPFSVIFSIILIVIFLVVAFFAIRYFLDVSNCAKRADFVDSLGNDIESARESAFSSKTFSGQLPSGIDYVCFANLAEPSSGTAKETEIYNQLRRNADYTANLFFYPPKGDCLNAANIEYVNFSVSNPYCFEVKDNNVEIRLEKGRFDSVVNVLRV